MVNQYKSHNHSCTQINKKRHQQSHKRRRKHTNGHPLQNEFKFIIKGKEFQPTVPLSVM